jgi:hypothetical protein
MKFLVNFKFRESYSEIVDNASDKDDALIQAKKRLAKRLSNDVDALFAQHDITPIHKGVNEL